MAKLTRLENESVYRPPLQSDQPRVRLTYWRIIEAVARGTRHCMGRNVNEGRVSSRIVNWDPATRIATTRSGREYELVGPSGYDSDAEYVWGVWKTLNDVDETRDVTDEYEPA